MRFTEFFAQATDCGTPYAYQRRLAEEEWPDTLIAPTGLGKTAAVILAWLWRRRIDRKQTPRRLVYCLPMRTLVEQTERNARIWLERLATAGLADNLPGPGDLHLLMGGIEARTGQPHWYETPAVWNEAAAAKAADFRMAVSEPDTNHSSMRPEWISLLLYDRNGDRGKPVLLDDSLELRQSQKNPGRAPTRPGPT